MKLIPILLALSLFGGCAVHESEWNYAAPEPHNKALLKRWKHQHQSWTAECKVKTTYIAECTTSNAGWLLSGRN